MKKMIILLLVLMGLVAGLWADVFITELADPNNAAGARFVELYNNGDAEVDLSDGWALQRWTNGNTSPQSPVNLTGTIAPGGFYIISANQSTFNSTYGFDADQNMGGGGPADSNGDEQIALLDASSTIVDMFGVPGEDGSGTNHEFEDGRAERKIGIVAGSTTYNFSEWNIWNDTGAAGTTNDPQNAPSDFDPGEWIGADTGGNALPFITNIVIDPNAPLATDTVTVSADVTDSDGTVTTVTLSWSIDETNFTDINMSLDTNSTYVSDTAIPAQVAGTTVYYKIIAEDDDSETSTSAIHTYTIPTEYTIYQIQGQQSTSPHVGENVITSGMVTAVFDDYIVIQDGVTSWSGIWVITSDTVAQGDNVSVLGTVSEDYSYGDTGNTIIVDASVTISSSNNRLPNSIVLTTNEIADEQYEGMLVSVTNAQCSNEDLGYGVWELNDGSGACRVNDIGYAYSPTLGTLYDVTGVLGYSYGNFNIEPRYAADIEELGDNIAPELVSVAVLTSTSLAVSFNEEVEQTSAETVSNYSIDGLTITAAVKNVADATQVILTVSEMAEQEYTLIVNNVEDLSGNAIVNGSTTFEYVDLPVTGDVIINEIGEPYDMPHTYQSSYIELYNATDTEIDISGWTVNSIDASRATSSFVFPEGTTIAANGYIIATRERANFLLDYGTYVDEAIVPVAQSTTGTGVYISNNYYFSLVMSNGTVLESTSSTVSWNSNVYERIDPAVVADEDTNWQLTYQSDPVQGTPGAANSTVPSATEYTIYQIQTEDHAGEMVLTTGIVTATFANQFTIQNGTGAFNGIWISSNETVALGDDVTIEGIVSENYDKTIITPNSVTINSSENALPPAVTLTTFEVSAEDYEGVLVHTTGICDNDDLGYGEWSIDDGTGSVRIDEIGEITLVPTIDYSYEVTGVVNYDYSNFKIAARDDSDIIETAADTNAPSLVSATATSNTTVEVIFSENVSQATAEVSTNYVIAGLTVSGAVLDTENATKVTLIVSEMAEQEYTLVVNDVEDLSGNAIVDGNINFSYTAPQTPGNILINEFDTNTSSYEYVELYNTTDSAIDLAATNYSLVFYNGNGDVEYQSTDLTGTIPANGFYVLAERDVTDLYGYTPDQNATWTSFQNGTDAIALVSGDDQIDAVIYGSAADTGLEGVLNLPEIIVPNSSTSSTGRLTDGQGGVNYANSDWDILEQRSPGATNGSGVTTPDAPTNIQISHDGTNVNITWDAVTGAVSYKIMVCDTPDGEYTVAAEGIAGTSWSNPETSSKKFYRVIAVN